MIKFEIPSWGEMVLEHLVLDFNGTIAFDGKLIPGIIERLDILSSHLQIHIISADTFGTVVEQCQYLKCTHHLLDNSFPGAAQKEKYIERLGASSVAAVGNGANDVAMLGCAALGIAVLGNEGLCCNALTNADLVVKNINDALDLLIYPKRLIATLRR
ncbi:MAG: HAD family hydrolase [Bacillota bacterium]|jgi:soluble P-type ATPase